MTVHRFKNTTVVQCENGTHTELPGDLVLMAQPEDTDSYLAQAHAIGYADGTAMCREHDYLHAALAEMLGLPHSPALMGAARGEPINDLTGAEERAVLAIAEFWNLARRMGETR